MSALLPIENYVPHRGAMLLLDALLYADADRATAQLTVPRDGLFLQDEGMPAWVGLEYMAQTVAAWAGWQAVQAGHPVKLGFLLGTRKFEAQCAFFAPGMSLHIQVHRELVGENGLGVFDCQIVHAEDGVDVPAVMARARVSVYEPDNGSAYIQALENSGNEQEK